jgi:hypothetical protein
LLPTQVRRAVKVAESVEAAVSDRVLGQAAEQDPEAAIRRWQDR